MVRRAREYKPEDDVRQTPPDFFAGLDATHHFTIDACALPSNAQCSLFYAPDGLYCGVRRVREGVNGLTGRYDGQRVWCNPPFSQFAQWLPWAWRNSAAETITMLAPGTRQDQPWWQKWVEPYRDDQPERRGDNTAPFMEGTARWRLKTDFLPGRLDFFEDGHPVYRKDAQGKVMLHDRGKRKGQPIESTAMFGCVLLEWKHE